jgi:hypothetical protein
MIGGVVSELRVPLNSPESKQQQLSAISSFPLKKLSEYKRALFSNSQEYSCYGGRNGGQDEDTCLDFLQHAFSTQPLHSQGSTFSSSYGSFISLRAVFHLKSRSFCHTHQEQSSNHTKTLYIYLSTAALLGLFFGSLLYFSSVILIRVLQLDQPPTPKILPAKRTVADYRASRRKKKSKQIERLVKALPQKSQLERELKSPTLGETTMWSSRGPPLSSTSQTILEEEDSEDYY